MKVFHVITIYFAIIVISLLNSVSVFSENYTTGTATVIVTTKFKNLQNAENALSSQKGDNSSSIQSSYIIADKMSYKILETTALIKGEKAISIERLSTPCKARITYQILKDGTRNLLTLKVLSHKKGASKSWLEVSPE